MTGSDAVVGMQLASQGRFPEALPFLERAHQQAPADMALLHATADALLQVRRGREAAERYRLADSRKPGDIGVLSGWARALLLIGDQQQALGKLEQALILDERYADPTGWLDGLVQEIGDTGVACELLRTLSQRQPGHAGLLRLFGKALVESERLDEAQVVLAHIARLRPADPFAHVELGRLAVSQGHTDAARSHFASALEAAPDSAAALWERAQIDGWRLDRDTLAQVLALTRIERNPRALAGLHDMLARHHDRHGGFEAAAAHVVQANALMASQVAPGQRYAPQSHEAAIASTMREFQAPLFDRLRGAGSGDPRPVFVVGLPRSGTTLLERMLAAHPSIVGVGEQAFALASLRRATARSGGRLVHAQPQDVHAAAHWHLHLLERRATRLTGAQGARIVDKMPDNYLLAGWLHIAFPNAAIVHCLRDPRDVALSCWMTQFADVGWSFELAHIAHRIEQHRRITGHWRSTLGARITDVHYEALIASPEAELRRLLQAIGLPWHADVLDFAGRAGFVASASRQQVREPLHARSLGRWRNYEAALRPVLPRLDAIAAQDASLPGFQGIRVP